MIDEEDVRHIEELAELELTEAEREELTQDLKQIVDYVKKLEKLDTEGVEPLQHILEVDNVLREDCKTETLSEDEVFKNAPARNKTFFQVPPVMEED